MSKVSYIRSPVVRALRRHTKGVDSIHAGGLIVDEFILTVPDLNVGMHVYDF